MGESERSEMCIKQFYEVFETQITLRTHLAYDHTALYASLQINIISVKDMHSIQQLLRFLRQRLNLHSYSPSVSIAAGSNGSLIKALLLNDWVCISSLGRTYFLSLYIFSSTYWLPHTGRLQWTSLCWSQWLVMSVLLIRYHVADSLMR